jgi:hypothetical protein
VALPTWNPGPSIRQLLTRSRAVAADTPSRGAYAYGNQSLKPGDCAIVGVAEMLFRTLRSGLVPFSGQIAGVAADSCSALRADGAIRNRRGREAEDILHPIRAD